MYDRLTSSKTIPSSKLIRSMYFLTRENRGEIHNAKDSA